ncbi:hypothetical protein F4679DRAFT_74206 [Xylaria curta]|nr:hypothetical protein F4679DRAFT_74206 [Xylaria curta]
MTPVPPASTRRSQRRFAHHTESTPIEEKVLSGKKLLDEFGAKYTRKQLFDYFGVSERAGYRILKDYPNGQNEPYNETRGRKRLMTKEQIDQIEEFLKQDPRAQPWQSLPAAAGLEFSDQRHVPVKETIRTAMHDRGWHKCGTCYKFWVNYDSASQREFFAREWLRQLGPNPESYRHLRYSHEVRFKWGADGKVNITRTTEERYCADCLQNRKQTTNTTNQQQHICLYAWACIGYNFKSDLVFYTVNNPNGSITLEAYRDQILEPHVKKWITRGDYFVLSEDGAAGHGSQSDDNIVKQWKTTVGPNYFFSCPGCPDLAPIENCFKIPNKKKHPTFTEDSLKAAVIEGWNAVAQETINEWCDSVPVKLSEIVNAKEQGTEN